MVVTWKLDTIGVNYSIGCRIRGYNMESVKLSIGIVLGCRTCVGILTGGESTCRCATRKTLSGATEPEYVDLDSRQSTEIRPKGQRKICFKRLTELLTISEIDAVVVCYCRRAFERVFLGRSIRLDRIMMS
jgi:hypothetical protein